MFSPTLTKLFSLCFLAHICCLQKVQALYRLVFDAQATLLEIKLIFCSSGFYAGAPTRTTSCLPVIQQSNTGKIDFPLFLLIFLVAHLTVQNKALVTHA